jgi:hypothetical protein
MRYIIKLKSQRTLTYLYLDSALIKCIGYKYESGNGKAAMHFEIMIGLK